MDPGSIKKDANCRWRHKATKLRYKAEISVDLYKTTVFRKSNKLLTLNLKQKQINLKLLGEPVMLVNSEIES